MIIFHRSILVSLRSDQLSVSSSLTGMNPPPSSSAPADPVNEDKRAAKIGSKNAPPPSNG